MRNRVTICLLLLLAMSATACVPGNARYKGRPAGFFWGIWHGWIAPVSLVLGIINPVYRVYECRNTGWWYDFGFYIAIISGFGGLSLSRRKKRKHRD